MIADPRNVFVNVSAQPDNARGGAGPKRPGDLGPGFAAHQKRCQATHQEQWPQLHPTKEHP